MKLTACAIRLIAGKNLAYLATVMADGSPHVTPLYVDREGDLIRVNTAEGRVKHKNVMRDPRVSIAITDSNNPDDRVIIQGRVMAITSEGAESHIAELSEKYTGQRKPTTTRSHGNRIIIKIEPIHITRGLARKT